jgi:3-phenylpropionate/trans-cinnamate dioxygenase ferredoxin reductase component
MTYGIIIIGAGHGGSQAAISLRQEGYEGPVTLISDEADVPYHRPPLSKTFIKSEDQTLLPLRPERVYAEGGIALRLATSVAAIDTGAHTVSLTDGEVLRYAKLLIATGARARRLTVPGHDLAGIHYMRTAEDARHLRDAIAGARNIAVVGGGFIGLETACTLAGLGKSVTVLEAAPGLLGRVIAPVLAKHIAALIDGLGIKVQTSTTIDRIEGVNGAATAVVTTHAEQIEADLVIAGIGAEPNTELAAHARLACANGIVVDPSLRTSDPDVFAIGDCAAYVHPVLGRQVRLESVQNATDHARLVARSMLGQPTAYNEVPWFWSDMGPNKLQIAGLSHDADRHVISGDPASNAFSIYHFLNGRLVCVESLNRAGEHMLARKMLSVGFTPSDEQMAAGTDAIKAALIAAA